MAKELPYFQFEPAEYLTKDISFCSLSAQGFFINLCSYYWQRECLLTKDQILRRLNNINEFDELIDEGVIDLKPDGQTIIIKFLDAQYKKATKQSQINSINGSKGGRPKKQKPKETEIKPKINRNESETKGIKEDKIREDEIKEDNINKKKPVFNFRKSLIDSGGENKLVEDWLKVRKTKKATNTETALEGFINEVLKSKKGINDILKICIERDWKGFKNSWIEEKEKSSAKKESGAQRLERLIKESAQ